MSHALNEMCVHWLFVSSITRIHKYSFYLNPQWSSVPCKLVGTSVCFLGINNQSYFVLFLFLFIPWPVNNKECRQGFYWDVILSVRPHHQQRSKFMFFFQSSRKGTNALNRTELPKCPCFPCRAPRLSASTQGLWYTHSSYSNHTLISWIQWLGKRQGSGVLRALGGLQCHDDKHKLGHWEREHGYGNPTVSMTTAVLTQLLLPHLCKYTR